MAKKKQRDNVIAFPIEHVKHPARAMVASPELPPSLADIKDVYYLLKNKKAEEMMQIIVPLITQGFLAYGMMLNDPKNAKNVALMLESIRSSIYGYFEIPHPFHPLSKNLFGVDEQGRIILKVLQVNDDESSTPNIGPRSDSSNTA